MQRIRENAKSGLEPPKKAKSAYLIFQRVKREEILSRDPTKKVTEVVSEIAKCWRSLSKQDRVPYKEQARKDKERYEKQLKELQGISSGIKRPKKCLSAYMIFVKEVRKQIVEANPNLGALEVMK